METLEEILAFLKTEVESAGHFVSDAINWSVLEQVAAQALLTGGVAPVLPALVDHVKEFAPNPTVAFAFVFAVKLAEKFLGKPPTIGSIG